MDVATDIVDTNEEKHELRFDAILDLAQENGVVDAEQALYVQEEHDRTGKSIRDVLIDENFISEDDLLGMLATYMGVDVVDLTAIDIPPEVRSAVPAAVARTHSVIPIEATPSTITLA